MSAQSSFLICDIAGTDLTSEDREVIAHPSIFGVILFERNFANSQQLAELIEKIKRIRSNLVIAVDQEGGRIQRFKNDLTRLPSLAMLGAHYKDHSKTLELSEMAGWMMAAELIACGLDVSFAPVVDLANPQNPVLNDRTAHYNFSVVNSITNSYIKGMNSAGMQAVAKHFPGHGNVSVDSHLDLPVDKRDLSEIEQNDLQTFFYHINHKNICALMTAHIHFSTVDDKPVTFSSYWLKKLLRNKYNFQGVIFSDDLNMKATAKYGDSVARAKLALDAGCDILLFCNNRAAVINILDNVIAKVKHQIDFNCGAQKYKLPELRKLPKWQQVHKILTNFLNYEDKLINEN